ncbi:KRI1-like family C-terminal-domain-containing protein [Syncephalis fuscata]|nr:KRI1-like family C-terminal-domain-containing protein [Syncephalis fuscata]
MSGSDGETFNIRVNESFAKKYEEKKRKEELGLLREKYGDIAGVDDDKLARMAERARKYGIRESEALLDEDSEGESSSSDEEDETGELLTPEMDAQIMQTLLALRSKDPRVYDKETNFYSEEAMKTAHKKWKETQTRKKNAKPVTLQDFQRKILLEEGGIVDEAKEMSNVMTHAQEQQMLKDDLKSAVSKAFDNDDDSDDDDDELLIKRNVQVEDGEGGIDYTSFLLEAIKSGDGNKHTEKILDSLKTDADGNTEDAFLLDYVLNRGWMDGSVGRSVEPLIEEVDLVEDERAVEAADHFESEYNFRYEEEGSTQLVHHSRNVEDTLRRKDNTRKLERERRKERKEEEKKKKMEELKRLKNLKKQEILDKLRKIQEITGNTNVGVDDVDLDEDFNPDNYDSTMSKLFNDNYYNENDKHKPVFEDDIDISDIIGDDAEENAETDKKKKKKKKKKKAEADKQAESALEYEINMDADYLPDGERFTEENSKTKEKGSKKRKALDDYLDEFYQLDYEDIVAGIPTRFKYRPVKAATFGLSPVEILMADDADLNAHISVKKLAPYRAPDVQSRDERKYSKKRRVQEFRKKLEQQLKQQEKEERKTAAKEDGKQKKRKKSKH